MTSYYTYYLQVLPDGLIRWVTLWEERFAGVDGEGEGHDGLGARPDYHALHPQPEIFSMFEIFSHFGQKIFTEMIQQTFQLSTH